MNRLSYIFLKYAFAVLFFAMAFGKLLDNKGFADVLASYQLGLSAQVLLPLALAIAFFELFVGYQLFKEKRLKLMASLVTISHLSYLLLAITTVNRGMTLDNCGCFGVFWKRPLTMRTVWEDAILLGLSLLFLYLVSRRPKRLF